MHRRSRIVLSSPRPSGSPPGPLPLRPSCSGSRTSTATRWSSPMPATSGRRPSAGGAATRLTAHPGLEMFARFSPDGKWIAFTGQYDGDEQVYVIPAAGGVPKQLTFYPARGPLPPRWGYDNQVFGWTRRRQVRPLPLAARRLGPLRQPASTPCPWTAASASRCPCPICGGARPLAGRQEGRLHPVRPRLPHLEALPGRLGPGPVDLRPRHPRGEEHHQHPAHRPRPDVDRRQDLLQLGPHRHPQPLRLRRGERRRPPSSPRASIGTSAGRAPTTRARSSTRWTASCTCSTPARAPRGTSPSRCPSDGLDNRPSQVAVADRDRGRSRLSPKGERAVFVARGDVFTAPIEKGVDPQPHPHLGRARQVGPLVAGRPEDRLHLRRVRRGGALADRSQEAGQARAAHHGRQGHALRPRVVARRQEDRLLGQGRPPLRGHPGRQEARPGRPGPPARDPRLPVVARRRLSGLQHDRPQHLPLDLDLERRGRQAARRSPARTSTSASPSGIPTASTSTTSRAATTPRSSTPSTSTGPWTGTTASTPSPCARTSRTPSRPRETR